MKEAQRSRRSRFESVGEQGPPSLRVEADYHAGDVAHAHASDEGRALAEAGGESYRSLPGRLRLKDSERKRHDRGVSDILLLFATLIQCGDLNVISTPVDVRYDATADISASRFQQLRFEG